MKFRCTFFLLSLIVTITGCSNPNTNSNKTESVSTIENSETVQSISGKVIEEIRQGRDGTVWNFVSDTGVSYSLIISIPNLGPIESQNIHYVKPGNKLTITGDVYNIGSEQRLLATRIKASL